MNSLFPVRCIMQFEMAPTYTAGGVRRPRLCSRGAGGEDPGGGCCSHPPPASHREPTARWESQCVPSPSQKKMPSNLKSGFNEMFS